MTHVLSWCGYTSLEKNYSFNPIPEDLEDSARKHILGLQGNMWAEYIKNEANAETMLWPRSMSIAETGWSRPETKDYSRFHSAALREVARMKAAGHTPFDLANEVGERPEYFVPVEHLAVGKPVKYIEYWSEDYPASQEATLVDGIRGGWSYEDDRWQGFFGFGLDAVIDLGEVTEIHEVTAEFMQDRIGWFFLPGEVTIAVSDNGDEFTTLATVNAPVSYNSIGYFIRPFGWKGTAEARYIRYTAKVDGTNPRRGYVFTDEIIVR